MNYVWIDVNSDPDWSRLARHGIDGVYLALGDARTTRVALRDAANRGFTVGVYMASNWGEYVGLSGPQIAEAVHQRVQPLVWSRTSRPKVQFDMEEHDPEKIASCLERWRELQPARDTSWTMESMQGGWMSGDFVQRVRKCKVRVVPQFYRGDMSPIAADASLRDLMERGFPESLVTGFWDAAALPHYWRGWAFTQARLPQ